jgi:NAD(P)-dependent dehydrogenase (short-subunit alcohol dehydrogenase family)
MAKAPRPLAGQVIAITGGARGIGRATAAALIAQGARPAIGDIDGKLAQHTAEELGAETLAVRLDVTRRASFEHFLDDVLVNNAGIMAVGPFVEETDVLADRMIEINLRGVLLGSKLALARFLPRRHGHIVNVASIAGKGGAPHVASYAATKYAVVGLTESLRQEYASCGIGFSVIMPVGVNTELYSGLRSFRGIKRPEPEDVGAAIVEALQSGRYEVYVPKRMQAVIRGSALLPLRWVDAIARALGTDKAVTDPDRAARAAYEQRLAATAAGAGTSEPDRTPSSDESLSQS